MEVSSHGWNGDVGSRFWPIRQMVRTEVQVFDPGEEKRHRAKF